MIAVIFEVQPAEGQLDNYLGIAASLKARLESVDGFISVERFQSLTDSNKYLSLSFFEHEEAIRQWRTTEKHRAAQTAGRDGVFENYRLRVASVIRDYGMNDRSEAPSDSAEIHN